MNTLALWLTFLGLVALALPYEGLYACSTYTWCYTQNPIWLPLCIVVTLMSFWIYKREGASGKPRRQSTDRSSSSLQAWPSAPKDLT